MAARQTNPKEKTVRLDACTCIETANALLVRSGGCIPPVTNIGRAALVIALFDSNLDIDYRKYESRWALIRDGSSHCEDDYLPFIIVATEHGAIEIQRSPDEPFPVEEVLDAALQIGVTFGKRGRVKLGELGASVIIDGQEYPPLTMKQHKVVSVLLVEGARGISLPELERKSFPSAWRILRDLSQKPGWCDVIVLGGKSGVGYRIKN